MNPEVVTVTATDYRALVVIVDYATAIQAKRAFERALRWAEDHPGRNVGVLRLTPNPVGGDSSAVDARPEHPLAIIAEDEDNLRRFLAAIRKAASGTMLRPTDDFARAVVLRRLRRALAHAGEPGALDVIRRHDDKGAQITHEGEVIEP